MNTSLSIFCESIAFFVVQACERLWPCSKLPRVLHHDLEVVVAVNGAADAFVVLAELLEGHDSVRRLRVPLRHELLEDLVGGLLALDDVGVFAGIVDLSDVREGHLAVLVDIELIVGSADPLLPVVVDLSLEAAEELVVADRAVAVFVEVVDEMLGLLLGEVEAVVDETPAEVIHIERAVTVVVHGFEDARDSLDSASRALQDLGLHLSDQIVD